jgi:hypothetical protein
MDWQPIETAPTTGKWVLLWNNDVMCVGCFYGDQWAYVGGPEPVPLWDQPTHWMELPDRPRSP